MAEKQNSEGTSSGSFYTLYAVVVLLVGIAIGFFVYTTTIHQDSPYAFKFGLDLKGGSHLVYEADVSGAQASEVPELMAVLKSVIERRVNVFGVSEPIVQVESSSVVSGERHERLVVELPGVTNVEDAIQEIGRTPLLEFKLVDPKALAAHQNAEKMAADLATKFQTSGNGGVKVTPSANFSDGYVDTGLTGRYLKHAELVFGKTGGSGLSNEPIVSVEFTDDGAKLFEEITRDNVGRQLAIFLDGEVLSEPVINEPISGGKAIISGNFTAEEARALVQNLNFGALPLPISLESTQTIGASLGAGILDKGITATVFGFGLVILFMLLWYRLPGLVAGIALIMYAATMLALFKIIPVTLTAAGLAGFILSVGMAVDANVLVFERMKEEYKNGKSSREAARIGFSRAWGAIRDGNATSILSAIILFWFGTSIVKGFALVFGLGVLVSMATALIVTRVLLLALPSAQKTDGTFIAKLFGSGLTK